MLNSSKKLQQAGDNHGADFTVMIVASGPVREGGLVHAIAVTQPVQSWTVIRGQDDFRAVSDALSQILTGLPPCPIPGNITSGDINALVKARNELQEWLTSILMYPGARESPAVRNFLTYAANMIPPQFEGVPWTTITTDGQVLDPSQVYSSQSQSAPANYANGNLDDMEMDDMFLTNDDVGPAPHEESDEEDDDFVRPSLRYKPTDEPITEEDEIDMMQLAGEVEMIEDIGSLAQSMGASHLGRSLKLQAELGVKKEPQSNVTQTGVRLGSALTGASSGGIGGAMERASSGIGDSFNAVKPESAPRLDSFKMIKVIGKGSFGKSFSVLVRVFFFDRGISHHLLISFCRQSISR
jgi:hypothetical protein